NWDLIPPEAIRSANLLPGSNPLFGLNTLGGALSIETKTGFSDPEAAARVLFGSFGRKLVTAQAGAADERVGVFAAARSFDETGWRRASPSHLLDGFLSAGYRRGPTGTRDRKSTRLNSSHSQISYAVFCLKKKKKK